jgi:GR25 family glycosyltransferase involved in LPS biosynthesis
MARFEAYLISLQNIPERRDTLHAMQEQLPDLHLVDAVDGRRLSREELQALTATGFLQPPFVDGCMLTGRKLSLGQLGCFLSHRRVVEQITQQEKPYALVLEDDITLVPDFVARVEELMEKIPFPFDILHLHVMDEQRDLLGLQPPLINPTPPGFWGTQAYLIPKTSASTILERLSTMRSTLDLQLSYAGLRDYFTSLRFVEEKDIPSYICGDAKTYISDVI